ncbi:hypothetical protein LBMAG34_4760 [Candidatus Saccharibacteria bacterium]|nr:hypothetical protein LBMAG34_4760 [Candidatus Saccharibacteria bacterium]
MNVALKSWIKKFVLVLTALLLVFSLAAPVAFAQDNKELDPNQLNNKIDEESETKVNDTVKACEEGTGGVSIVVCPVVNLLVRGITRLTLGGGGQEDGQRKSPLISFLAVDPPRASINGDATPLANVVNNVVIIANSIYILVFLVLIFGSSLPFFTAQNYTIKKTLPKLIIAVILTQFTLPITGIVIDFFNLLGYAIPNILLAIGQVPDTVTGAGDTTSKVGAGIGFSITSGLGIAGTGSIVLAGFGWIFIIGFLLAALISVIVAFVYMIIRYFLIYVMILIAPLAFVAWVIPGTEKFFKQWWTDFIRLNAMFVTIMALLSSSVVISAALTAQNAKDPNGTGIGILPAVMPIVALFLIPKTLKATTKGLSALSGAVLGAAGAATGKATSKAKEAGKAQIQEQRGAAAAAAFGKNTSFGRTRAALLQGKLPTAKGQFQAGQKASAFNAEQRKIANESLQFQGSNLDFGSYQRELRNIASGKGSAVLKAKKGDRNVQIAAGNILAQQGDVEHIRAMLGGGTVGTGADAVTYAPGTIDPQTLSEFVQPSFGDLKSAAPDLTNGGNPNAFEGLSAEKIASLDASSIKEMSKYHDPGGGGAAKSLELQKQLSLLRQDPNLRNKLSQKQIDALNADSRGVRF